MDTYVKELEAVVSQAALHLHTEIAHIGTALIDRAGEIVFSNNAFKYADEKMLNTFARRCPADSQGIIHEYRSDGLTVFTVPLDDQHVFVVIGRRVDAAPVNRFMSRLRRVLPSAAH